MKKIILLLTLGVISATASNKGACESYMESIDEHLTNAKTALEFNVPAEAGDELKKARQYYYWLQRVCVDGQDTKAYFNKIKNFKGL